MSKKPFILAYGNQKGGVAKTTTTLNAAYALANTHKKKVLLIDMDSQGSASLNVGIDISADETNTIDTLLDVLVKNELPSIPWQLLQNYIYTPTFDDRVRNPLDKMKWLDVKRPFGFDVIPSSLGLSVTEMKMGLAGGKLGTGIRTDYLSKIIKTIAENRDYDYVLIDTPPSLGALSLNSMAAATDGIIITSSVDIMSIRGISTFIETTEAIKETIPEHRGVLGILLSLYSERRIVDRSIEEWVKEFLPIPTFETRIPETSNVKKANSSMLLVSQLDRKMKTAFDSFTEEIIYACENPDALIGSAKWESENN